MTPKPIAEQHWYDVLKAGPIPYLQQYATLADALKVRIKEPSPDPMLTSAPIRKGMATEIPSYERNMRRRKAMTTSPKQKIY